MNNAAFRHFGLANYTEELAKHYRFLFSSLIQANETNGKSLAFFTLHVLTGKHVTFVPSCNVSYASHLNRV